MRAEQREFRGDVIRLDGNEFIGCHFERCTLSYAGGQPPVLVGGSFVNCQWVFDGSAANTLGFLRALYAQEGGLRRVVADTFSGLDAPPTRAKALAAGRTGARQKRGRLN